MADTTASSALATSCRHPASGALLLEIKSTLPGLRVARRMIHLGEFFPDQPLILVAAVAIVEFLKNVCHNQFVACDSIMAAPPVGYQFHGRDFTPFNNMYLQKILEFHEMTRMLHFNQPKHSPSICTCPGFLKCYHLIVHEPYLLTAEFAQRTWPESIRNDDRLNMSICDTPVRAGRTSTTSLKQLMFGKQALLSEVVLACHVDPVQRKAVELCANARNAINRRIAEQNERQREQSDAFYDALRSNMDAMTQKLAKSERVLFECALQIQHTDIDLNAHVNQAVFGKFIENAMCAYCSEYGSGIYLICGITLNFVKEMPRLSVGQGAVLPMCSVKICGDTQGDGKREVVGVIQREGAVHAQFKLNLERDRKLRMTRIRSVL